MPAVLADTHAALWYLLEPSQLSSVAEAALDAIAVSALVLGVPLVTRDARLRSSPVRTSW